MLDKIKENYVYIVIPLVLSVSLSYGLTDFINFFKGTCIIVPILYICAYIIWKNQKPNTEMLDMRDMITELDNIIGEQTKVIDEYENIFDSQVVQLPCVCGGNTFEGLFSSNSENIVECQKCNNKYRININYDTVLISEPSNKTFEQIVASQI